MGEWDDACVVCAGPTASKHSAQEHDIEWLDSCLGITEASTDPVQLGPYDSYGSYGDDKDFVSHAVWSAFHPEEFGQPRKPYLPAPWYKQAGIVCHKACWELLYKELGYKMKHSDVWPQQLFGTNLLKRNEYITISYGGMKSYHDQFFDMYSCLGGTPWMVQDPRICTKNAKRILQIWKPLVRQFKESAESSAASMVTSLPLCCLESYATGSGAQVRFGPTACRVCGMFNNLAAWK